MVFWSERNLFAGNKNCVIEEDFEYAYMPKKDWVGERLGRMKGCAWDKWGRIGVWSSHLRFQVHFQSIWFEIARKDRSWILILKSQFNSAWGRWPLIWIWTLFQDLESSFRSCNFFLKIQCIIKSILLWGLHLWNFYSYEGSRILVTSRRIACDTQHQRLNWRKRSQLPSLLF